MTERKNWTLLAGILLVACIYAGELTYVFSLTPDPCEDAYITFRFSKNLADGMAPFSTLASMSRAIQTRFGCSPSPWPASSVLTW